MDPWVYWQQALLFHTAHQSLYTPVVPLSSRLRMEGADAEGSENAIW